MKRTLVCIAILAVMTVTGIALDIHTERVTGDIYSRVAALTAVKEHDVLEREAVSISRDWEDFCAKNIFLTNNEGAFEISEALAHIVSEIKTGDDDVAEECIETQMLIEMYVKSRALSPENIF